MQGGNLLLLDEPTNDLDVDTLRALEEAIDAFNGCAVIVSHDRYFLDRVATHTLAFEDDGAVVSSSTRKPAGNVLYESLGFVFHVHMFYCEGVPRQFFGVPGNNLMLS